MRRRKVNVSEEKIVVDGMERTYVVHVPKVISTDPDMMLSCHPGSSNGLEWWSRVWSHQAEKGFIIVCPSGGTATKDTHWVALGDAEDQGMPGLDEEIDERFLLALISKMKTDHGVKNIFMSGFSSGAKMTYHMYLKHADMISGFGMTGHGLTSKMVSMVPSVFKPVHISFGTLDDNFANPGPDLTDAVETWDWFLHSSGCAAKPPIVTQAGTTSVAKVKTFACAPVMRFVKMVGMPHRWPMVRKGEPWNLDDELIGFWRDHAGMKL